MNKQNVINFVITTCMIVVAVLLLMALASQWDEANTAHKYPNVKLLNTRYIDTLEALHYVLPVTYYEWEEAANSAGITTDELTIPMFLNQLKLSFEIKDPEPYPRENP